MSSIQTECYKTVIDFEEVNGREGLITLLSYIEDRLSCCPYCLEHGEFQGFIAGKKRYNCKFCKASYSYG